MTEGMTDEEMAAAQRMADAVNLHVTAQREAGRETPGYVAINLDDGRSPDNTLYDTRADAVKYHGDNPYRFYVRVSKDTMPVRQALLVLMQARQAFKAGIVFGREEVITPHLPELMAGQIPRTLRAAGFTGRPTITPSGLIVPN